MVNVMKNGLSNYLRLGLPKNRFKRIRFFLGKLLKKAILFQAAIYHSQTGKYGLQKETFFFAKPYISVREEKGWVELVENGVNILAE